MGAVITFPPRGKFATLPAAGAGAPLQMHDDRRFQRDLVDYEVANARFDAALRAFNDCTLERSDEERRREAVRLYRAKLLLIAATGRTFALGPAEIERLERSAHEQKCAISHALGSWDWLEEFQRSHALGSGEVTTPNVPPGAA